jgi:hypothetical protein
MPAPDVIRVLTPKSIALADRVLMALQMIEFDQRDDRPRLAHPANAAATRAASCSTSTLVGPPSPGPVRQGEMSGR